MKNSLQALYCTRCGRPVSQDDPDVRFKHGEVIACSPCQVNGVIVIPTPEEIEMNFRIAYPSNQLDAEIERQELNSIFAVSCLKFTEETIKRLGHEDTRHFCRIFDAISKVGTQINREIIRIAHKAKHGGTL